MGVDLARGVWALAPFVGLDYVHASQDGFTESGSALGNLTAPEYDYDALRAIAGLRLGGDSQSTGGGIVPSVRLAYAHNLLDEDAFTAGFASAPGSSFILNGADLGDDRLLVGAGLAARLTARAQLGLAYDGEFSADDRAHSLTVRFRMDF